MIFHDPSVPIYGPRPQPSKVRQILLFGLCDWLRLQTTSSRNTAVWLPETVLQIQQSLMYYIICAMELSDICQIFVRKKCQYICQTFVSIYVRHLSVYMSIYHCLSQEFGISSLASWRNAENPELIHTYVQIFTVSWKELVKCWMWRFPQRHYGFGTLRSGPSKHLWTTQSCA